MMYCSSVLLAQLDPTALLRVLADPIRLRTLALLELEELSVGDLASCLGLAQSRVSNHLRVLREHDLLIERRQGTRTLLRSALSDGPSVGGTQAAPSWPLQLWQSLRTGLEQVPEHETDRMRLGQLLAERRTNDPQFFDHLAGEWDKRGAAFETGQARQRAVCSLLGGGLVLADLGCGTGYMARAMTAFCSRLICVDASKGMLEEAKTRLAPLGLAQIEFREGALDALPIEDDELDGAVAGLVMHHLPTLNGALREMRRVIRPGGTAVVLELAPHREDWMSAELGDRHLGLEPTEVAAALGRAGFEDVHTESVEDHYRPVPAGAEEAPSSLSLYIVRGRVPLPRTHLASR